MWASQTATSQYRSMAKRTASKGSTGTSSPSAVALTAAAAPLATTPVVAAAARRNVRCVHHGFASFQGMARATVGDMCAARQAGYMPAQAPITRVASTPPMVAQGGTTVGQPWYAA